MHITQLVSEYFNGNAEHASTDQLRRTAQSARFGQTPTNVNNVALPDNCNFDEDAVTVGAIFLALVTFNATDVFRGHISFFMVHR